ncbi:M24 family metallopeptidase [Mycobacterium sp. smrl_JER01]|uniref:M24 family metallopeptidase n=1 Tax=Mycobacterium sp. smrl_JER01 TaxID=3402633 RepID=UPI003AC8FBB8
MTSTVTPSTEGRIDRHGFSEDPRPFTAEEYRRRLAEFQKAMLRADIDVLVVTMPEHLNYLTGFDPLGIYLYSAVIVSQDAAEPVLITHKCEKGLAYSQCWIRDIRIWAHGQDPIEFTAQVLREIGLAAGARVAMEMANWYLHAAWYQQLRMTLPTAVFVDGTDIGQRVRMIKSPAEIELIRQAAAFADLGLSTAITALRPGVSERELNAKVLAAMAEAGSEYAALPMIIGSGERSGLFHAAPSARIVGDGEPVMFEITGVAARYNSNIVRTLVAGVASPQLTTLWEVVLEAFWRPFEMVKPGTPVAELDRESRRARAEYERYIPARTGFGMGLAYPPVWVGYPDILDGDEHVLEPGMVFSMEPSIAHYNGVSMIYGYNILVTETGGEILHSTPRDLFEVRA